MSFFDCPFLHVFVGPRDDFTAQSQPMKKVRVKGPWQCRHHEPAPTKKKKRGRQRNRERRPGAVEASAAVDEWARTEGMGVHEERPFVCLSCVGKFKERGRKREHIQTVTVWQPSAKAIQRDARTTWVVCLEEDTGFRVFALPLCNFIAFGRHCFQ